MTPSPHDTRPPIVIPLAADVLLSLARLLTISQVARSAAPLYTLNGVLLNRSVK
jgi:hypothetical protein